MRPGYAGEIAAIWIARIGVILINWVALMFMRWIGFFGSVDLPSPTNRQAFGIALLAVLLAPPSPATKKGKP